MTPRPDTGSLAALLAQATPGPWTFDCQTDGTDYDGIEYVVPFVDGPWGRGKSVVVHEYESVAPESEAVQNARLISLAPDMARLLVDVYGKYAHQFDDETLARFAEIERRAAQ